jgi:organic hydroperoxide reductase OsmC/OhrA
MQIIFISNKNTVLYSLKNAFKVNDAHNYEVELEWVEGRTGILSSRELSDKVEVATPPQFPKGVERIWSPEHLFTAAVNSCLMTTFLSIAENSKLLFSKFSSKAVGKLEIIDGKYIMSEVTLNPTVTIFSEDDREKALRMLNKSEAVCLISNSIKSKINFNPEILVDSSVAVNGH